MNEMSNNSENSIKTNNYDETEVFWENDEEKESKNIGLVEGTLTAIKPVI